MKKLRKGILTLLLLATVTAVSVWGTHNAATAYEVTDTITVKVGYYGMAEEDFVEAGTYHWAEIEENLPLYEIAYSFFNDGGSAWSHDGGYSVTETAGYGFYIEDLLRYAHVSLNSVQSIDFYTKDRDTGYRSYFTAGELFWSTQYYFKDLHRHLHFLTDEEGNLLYDEYDHLQADTNEAWDYAKAVHPMLALESNWISSGDLNAQEEYFFSLDPLSAGMSPASRFRLLFGQSDPLDSGNQRRSAKLVHTLYVTLNGSTVYGSEIPDFDTTVGSHTFQITMTSENVSLLEVMNTLLGFESSDDTILQITGWTAEASSEFADVTTITVSYDVLKEGNVTITATGAAAKSYGGGSNTAKTVETTPAQRESTPAETPEAPTPEAPTPDTPSTDAGNDASTETADTSGTTERPDTDETPEKPDTGGSAGEEEKPVEAPTQPAETTEQPSDTAPKEEDSKPTEQAAPAQEQAVTASEPEPDDEETGVAAADVGTEPAVMSKQLVYPVSRELDAALRSKNKPEAGNIVPPLPVDPEEDEVEELTIEENDRMERILKYTGLAALGICLLGGASSAGWYELKRRIL